MKNKFAISILILILFSIPIFAGPQGEDPWVPDGDREAIRYSNQGVDLSKTSISYINSFVSSEGYNSQKAGTIFIPKQWAQEGMVLNISDSYNLAPTITFTDWTPAFIAPFVGSTTWLKRYGSSNVIDSPYHVTSKIVLTFLDDKTTLYTKNILKQSDLNSITIGQGSSYNVNCTSLSKDYLTIKIEIQILKPSLTPYGTKSTSNPYHNFPWNGSTINANGFVDTRIDFDFGRRGNVIVDYYNNISSAANWASYNRSGVPATSSNLTIYNQQYDSSGNPFSIFDTNFSPGNPLNITNRLNSLMVEHNYAGNYDSNEPPNVKLEVLYDGKLVNIVNPSIDIDYTLSVRGATIGGTSSTGTITKGSYADVSSYLDYKGTTAYNPNTGEFDGVTTFKRADVDIHLLLDTMASKNKISGKYKSTINYRLTVN